MKTRLVVLLTLAIACTGLLAWRSGGTYRHIPHKDFERGEKFTYVAHYLGLNGGKADIELDEKIHHVNGRPCYKVEVAGKTTGVASWVYHVDDLWRSFIDTSAIVSQQFHRDIEEGKSYTLVETTTFDHVRKKGILEQKKKNKYHKKEFEIPAYPQDMISGYYYLRTIDYTNKQPGDIISMNAVYEDSVYDFKVKYLGKDVVKTRIGKINTLALTPIMPENKLFDGGDAITIYVSDDRNRVPVRVRAKMFLGAVNIELEDYDGLKHKFNFAD